MTYSRSIRGPYPPPPQGSIVFIPPQCSSYTPLLLSSKFRQAMLGFIDNLPTHGASIGHLVQRTKAKMWQEHQRISSKKIATERWSFNAGAQFLTHILNTNLQ